MDTLNQHEPARRALVDPGQQAAEAWPVTSRSADTASPVSHDAPEKAPDVDQTVRRDDLDVSAKGGLEAERGGDGDNEVPQVDGADGDAPATEASHRRRRTFAQRSAAAQDQRAALETEKRKLRTRGAIVAGALLVRLAKTRPAIMPELAAAVDAMHARDREALRLFAPELSA